eukprot:2003873-Pleurochrysis_carterae.AAC.2
MHTTLLNFNVVMNQNAFLCLRLWCSSRKQMREFDDLRRYMTERHVPNYISSTRGNSCDAKASAHRETEKIG